MSTRLLERIDRELAAAGDTATRVRLLQDRAVALTRIGRGDESRAALAAARAEQAREHAALARIAWEATAHEQREARRLLAETATTESGR